MTERRIPDELLCQIRRDREAIRQELSELADRDARMREAAAEHTLCGHLRQAIHRSPRPLDDIARAAGISAVVLCDFLESEQTLRSDVLDRLAQAVGGLIGAPRNAIAQRSDQRANARSAPLDLRKEELGTGVRDGRMSNPATNTRSADMTVTTLKDFSWERMVAAVEDVRERVCRAARALQARFPEELSRRLKQLIETREREA